MKLGIGLLLCLPGSLLLGPHILRVAAQPVRLFIIDKFHLHEGLCPRLGILAAQHPGSAVLPAGTPVQGKRNGIENRSLSRSRIPGDQINSSVPQGLHVKPHLPGIGAECGQNQLCRSHRPPSHISSISPRANALCSPLMG